jgi:hypothetical protein
MTRACYQRCTRGFLNLRQLGAPVQVISAGCEGVRSLAALRRVGIGEPANWSAVVPVSGDTQPSGSGSLRFPQGASN